MSIFLQHVVVVIPSVAAVVIALLNRRTIREVRVSLNGTLEGLIDRLERAEHPADDT